MSQTDLDTYAEKQAKKAEDLDAFSSVKLSHLKSQVAKLLDLIGNEAIFDKYTKHDISHVNQMLDNLEWIVPAETKEEMSPADWLMTVVATYFHDLGMIVTSDEFANRDNSEFEDFVENYLFHEDKGEDYRERINRIPEDDRDRFKYQEFVRHNHATRIKKWINGNHSEDLGGAQSVIDEIDGLLSDFDKSFRRDLADICESHHLDDISDTEKYNPYRPYGNSKQETANLQYCAILLRAADLLHITSDRAPSITFRAINPADPISQREWSKQEAVKNIRPDPIQEKTDGKDADTIEVHAEFEEAEGFFALTEYLDWAEKEIQECNEIIDDSKEKIPNGYKFPWINIEDQKIEAEGFERNSFEFALDQERILELLTGHTLYNDTDVVIRELVQNSIDAIRLKSEQKTNENASYNGKININWDTDNKTLEIEDNGTGMTQDIIEQHLLTVGSSRYQENNFQEDHPDFNAISEFGIGILSSFMISNKVEIITGHEKEDPPRQISFRSVHGRYLIKHLEEGGSEYEQVTPHGTVVRLELRPSADLGDIKEICKRWFVVPPCDIELTIDKEETLEIGHDSIGEAVETFVQENIDKIPNATDEADIKIKSSSRNGVDVSYAVIKKPYYDDWHFLGSRRPRRRRLYRDKNTGGSLPELGISIEGIRITEETPGYKDKPIVAMANLSGGDRPKTNVARTGLKSGDNFKKIIEEIYNLYFEHVEDEIEELHKERSYSLSWATRESKRIISPLNRGTAEEEALFQEAGENVDSIMVETNGDRQAISLSEINTFDSLWTIDSALLRRSDRLFRDLPEERSYKELVEALDLDYNIPSEPILCNVTQRVHPAALNNRTPKTIKINSESKRIDVMWGRILDGENRWLRPKTEDETQEHQIYIQCGEVELDEVDNKNVIRTVGSTLYLSSKFVKYFSEKFNEATQEQQRTLSEVLEIVTNMVCSFDADVENIGEEEFKSEIRAEVGSTQLLSEHVNMSELYNSFSKTDWEVFDPNIWFSRFDRQ